MAGQNADMTLKVGLDLNFFKQELQKASSSLAGEPIDINVRFSKKSIGDQYNLLSRWLRAKKTFDIKIESNTLSALTDKVANFQKTLKDLKDEKIELSINASANIEKFSKEKIRKIRAQIRSDIVSGGAGEIQIPTKLAAPSTSAFVKDVAKKVKEQTNASYAEGGVPIATKLKVPGITDLLKALQKNLNRNPISIATSFKESGKSEAALAKIIRNAEKNKAVLGTELAPLGADEIAEFRRTVESKLSGIKVTVDATVGKGFAAGQTGLAGLEEYMRTQGMFGGQRGAVETKRRAQFESLIGSASSTELKRYMKTAEIAGRSALTTKAQMQEALLKINDVAMENILGNMKMQMRDPLPIKKSFLDQVARAIFWMAGVDPAYLKQQAAQRRALPSVDFPGTVPARNIPIGPSSTGRALPAGASAAGLIGGARPPAGLLPAITAQSSIRTGVEALFAAGGPQFPAGPSGKLAMSAGMLQTRVDEILFNYFKVAEVTIKEIFNPQDLKKALNIFSYLPQALRDAESRTRQARIGIPSARGIAGLLPAAAAGRTPSPYATGAVGGETRAEMMARREREARMRSDLRGMDVMGGGAGRPPAPYSYAYRSARPTSAIIPYGAPGAIVPQPRGVGEPLTGQATPFASPLPKNYLEIGKIIKGIDPILQRSSVPFSGAIRELGEEFGFAIKQVLLFGTAYKALAFFMDLPAQALRASAALQSFNNQLNAITGGSSQAARSVEFINNTVERFNVPLQSAREGFLRLYASMSPAGMDANTIENLFVGISQASATLGLSSDQVDRVTYAFSQMASKGKVMSEEVTGQLGDVIPGALSLMADAAGMSMADFKKAMEDGLVSGKAMEQLFSNLPIVLEQRFGAGAAGAAKTLQGQLNDLATSTTRLYEAFEPIVNSIAGVVLPALSSALADAQSAVSAFGMKIEGINPATNLLSENAQSIYRNLEIVADTASSLISVIQSLGGVFGAFGNILSGALQLFNAIAGNPVGEFFVKLAVNIGLATAAINLLVTQGIVRAITNFALMIGNIQLTIGALRTLITTSRAAKIAVGGIVAGSIMVGLEMLVTHLSRAREETEKLRKVALLTADALRQMSYQQLVAEERSVQSRISKLEQLQAAAGPGLQIKNFSKQQEAMALELGLPISGRAGQRAISLTRAEGLRQQLLEELPRIRGEMKGRFEAPSGPTAITPIDLAPGEGKAKAEKGRVSLDRLVNAQFAQRAALLKSEAALAREETAAMAPDTMQAERMLKYYTQFREQLIDMATIQAQIEDAEKNRSAYIKDGMSASQLDYNVQQLRNELQVRALDLAAIEQKYRNEARKDAAKEAEEQEKEMQKRIDQQKEMNRLLEDARIQAGLISPAEAAGILQRREFEDAQARFAAIGGDPSQLASIQAAIPQAGSLQESIKNLRQELEKLASTQEMVKFSANAIGDAFATAFKDAITGAATTQEALAGFFRNLGSAFADMAAQMIQKMITMYILNQALNILPGMGSFSGGAKIGQSVSMPTGAGIGAGAGILQNSMGQGFGTFGPNFGIRQFANGGVVTGPTLGLVGEGRYNEAVVPLPDGKSIPVQLGGGAGGDISTNIVVNVSNGQASSQMSGNGGQALGRELEGAVRQVILKETRPGGLIYSAR